MKSTKNKIFDVSLVIPVYNNSLTLKKQLKRCIAELQSLSINYEILIGNDKSSDNTKTVLSQFNKNKHIRIFNHKENLGIAKNILFLYKKAEKSHIVLYSLDGDWNPHDITRLIKHAQKYDKAIVIGKRKTNNFRFKRRVVSVIYNLLPYMLFGVKTYDTGSIKLFKKELLEKIPIYSESISFEAELLIKAIRMGYPSDCIPVYFKKNKYNKHSGVNIQVVMNSFFDLLLLRFKRL